MPVCFTKNIDKIGTIQIWEITESEQELLSFRELPVSEQAHIFSLNNEVKRKQRLAYRVMLEQLLNSQIVVSYHSSGKPLLNNGMNLSLSHTKNYVAVFVSPSQPVGIDIEAPSEKMIRTASYYLTEKEMQEKNLLTDMDKLSVYWGGKESMFKLFSEYRPIFNRDLSLESFSLNAGQTKACIQTKDIYAEAMIYFQKINDFYLVYCLGNE